MPPSGHRHVKIVPPVLIQAVIHQRVFSVVLDRFRRFREWQSAPSVTRIHLSDRWVLLRVRHVALPLRRPLDRLYVALVHGVQIAKLGRMPLQLVVSHVRRALTLFIAMLQHARNVRLVSMAVRRGYAVLHVLQSVHRGMPHY